MRKQKNHTSNWDTSVDVIESFSKINATNRDVCVALPGTHHWLEGMNLRIWTSHISVEPNASTAITLILDLASVRTLAPATAEFLRQGKAHAAIIGHVTTSIDHHVNIVRIVQWLWTAPYNGEWYSDILRSWGVREFSVITINRVRQKSGIYTSHSSLNVELTHKSCLNDELLKSKLNTNFRTFFLLLSIEFVIIFHFFVIQFCFLIIFLLKYFQF